VPKFAILSDIHANLQALTAVLEEVDRSGADRIVIGGDTVGYGAAPAACVGMVRARGAASVLGNHDYYTLQLRQDPSMLPADQRASNPVWAGVAHAAESLSEDAAAWLESLPRTLDLPGAVLAHASLHELDAWPYLHTQRDAKPTLKALRKQNASLGFFGHTHRQDLFADASAPDLPEYLEKRRVHIPTGSICAVLVGSVGQPRDGDLRAAWVLWDSDERIVEFRRTPYPALEAALDILAGGLPEHSAHRLLDPDLLMKLRQIVG
jgi:predicted phosphodiesterase